MLTVLKNIEDKLQNAGSTDKVGSSNYVSKLVEHLIQLNTMVEASTRDDMNKVYTSLKHTISMLISFAYDEKFNEVMLSRVIGRVLVNILKLFDFTKINDIMKEIIEIVAKHKGSTRILAGSLTNLILRNSSEIEYFPGGIMNEIFVVFAKVNKNTSDAGLKMITLSTVRYLIKMKLMMSQANVAEILKIIQRSIAERVDELKLMGFRTLKNLLKILPSVDFYANHELLISLCTKNLEEVTNKEIKRQISFCLAHIIAFKNLYEKDPVNAAKSKKFIRYSEGGDPINEGIQFCIHFAYKANHNRDAYYDTIFLCFLHYQDQIKNTNLTCLVDNIMNFNQKLVAKKDMEPSGHYFRIGKFFESLAVMLNENQKVTYWDILCDRLRHIAQKKEASGEPTSATSATGRRKTYLTSVGKWSNDALVLLTTLNRLTNLLGIEFIDKYPKPNAFVDILEKYLTTSSNQLQLQSAEVIGNLVSLFPKWRAQLLSRFMNQLQMARGDLNILASTRDIQDIDEFDYKFNTLKGNILAVVNLSKNIDFEHVSIPFDLANSIFEAGKSLIAENNSEGGVRNYGYLGWILINGVMSMDYHWIGSRLKTLMDLWKSVFGNEESFQYTEDALLEKILAIKSLRKFLGICKKLHSENVNKLTGSFLCGYLSYIATAEKPKGLLKKGTPLHTIARAEAFRCSLRLNPLYFATKLNALLQIAIEDVSNYYEEDLLYIVRSCLKEDSELARIMESGGKSIWISVKDTDDFMCRERAEIAKTIAGCDIEEDDKSTSLERRSVRLTCLQSEILFIGHAFTSPNFSLKNKQQLVKFLVNNSKQFSATRDPGVRNLRLLSLLLIAFSITKKYYTAVQEHKSIEIKNEIFDAIREACETCWQSGSNYVRCASGAVYGMIFGITTSRDVLDSMFKTLYDKLNDPSSVPAVTAILGFVFKYGRSNIDEKTSNQIINIFQKSSRIIEESTKVWLANALLMAFQHGSDKIIREMLKTCLPFILILHLRCKEGPKSLYYTWSRIFEKISRQEKSSGMFNYQLEAILMDNLETFYSGSDFIFKTSKLLLTKSQIQGKKANKNSSLKKVEKLVNKIQSPQMLVFSAEIQKIHVDCLMDILNRQNHSELLLVVKKINKIIISKLVAICTLKPRNKALYDAVAQNFLDAQLEQLKLKLSYFDDQLLFIRDVVFKGSGDTQSNIVDDDDDKEKEAPVFAPKKQDPVFDFILEISMHPNVQLFALKSLENLLHITNPQTFKPTVVVNFATLVIPFVFKVASLNMEKIQETGLKLFLQVFKMLYNFTETGDPVETNSEQERAQSGLLMRQYGAQIDALIKLNMKNLSESSARCILHAFKLFQKFCKLMIWEDSDMVRKLFAIVSQGVVQPLKLSQSTYHSEKELTQIHVLRIKILCKIYNYLIEYNTGVDINAFYPNWLCVLMKQHSQAILRDSLYILSLRRRELKTQEKFYFVYNGHKISYDEHIFYDSIPTLIKTLLKLEHCDIDKQELDGLENREISKVISKNQKTLIDISDDERHDYQILILIFVLCHNEAIDYATENNAKRLRKLYPSHLNQIFKFKDQVLVILLDVMEKTFIPEDQIVTDLVHLLFKYVMLGNDLLAMSVLKIYKCLAQKEKISKDTYRTISTYIIELRNIIKNDVRNTFINTHELLELCYQTFIPIFSHCLDNITVKGATDLLNEDVLDEVAVYLKLFIEDFQDPESIAKKQILAAMLQSFTMLLQRYNTCEHETERKLLKEIIHENLSSLLEPILVSDSSTYESNQMALRIIFELFALCNKSKDPEFMKYQMDLLSVFLSSSQNIKVILEKLRQNWKLNDEVQLNALPFVIMLISSKISQIEKAGSSGKGAQLARDKDENECLLEIFKLLAFIYLDNKQTSNAKVGILALELHYFVIVGKSMPNASCLPVMSQLLTLQIKSLDEDQKHQISLQLSDAEKNIVYHNLPAAKPEDRSKLKERENAANEKKADVEDTSQAGTIQLKKGFGFFKKK